MDKARIYAFADEADPAIDGQIAAMLKNGVNGLEIRGVDGQNIADISLEKAREVRAKLDNAGLITWSMGSPIGKIDIETGDFAAHKEQLKHVLELADILDAKRLRMFSFYIPEGKDPALYKNEVIDRLGQMAEIAEGSGVWLCHENEKGIYGDIAPRCLEVLKAVPSLKGIFDPANFIQCGQDTKEAWALLKPYITYLHVKDAKQSGDVVPAGAGIGNLPYIVGDFMASGGLDFTIEPHLSVFSGLQGLEREGEQSQVGNFVYPDNETAFAAAVSAFKNIVKEVG